MYWGASWICLVSLLSPAPTPPSPLVFTLAQGTCTVNRVFTFILNDFLGTNHVFTQALYISVKIEMENFASGWIIEVGMEAQNQVGGAVWGCGRRALGPQAAPSSSV